MSLDLERVSCADVGDTARACASSSVGGDGSDGATSGKVPIGEDGTNEASDRCGTLGDGDIGGVVWMVEAVLSKSGAD